MTHEDKLTSEEVSELLSSLRGDDWVVGMSASIRLTEFLGVLHLSDMILYNEVKEALAVFNSRGFLEPKGITEEI